MFYLLRWLNESRNVMEGGLGERYGTGLKESRCVQLTEMIK